MKYQKKPIIVEAFQLTEDVYRDPEKWPPWLHHSDRVWLLPDSDYFASDGMKIEEIYIRTSESDIRVRVNDWIIKGVKGELYPCKPDVFAATYDPIEFTL